MHRFSIIIILIGSFINAQTYLDSTAAIDDRVDDLLSRMTLAEKIGQMTQAERTAFDSERDITTATIQINDNPLDNIISGYGRLAGLDHCCTADSIGSR
ncbi:MAG: hypothetical protein KDF60_11450 [Calditrichaeota bacterium]|nr:hypothetical protein [Calditrichota bacterium]